MRSTTDAGRHSLAAAVVPLLAGLALLLPLSGCSAPAPADPPLRMFIPNSPGGGYDLTGRAAAKALEDNDLAGPVEIAHVRGGSGTVALQRMRNERGAEDLVLTMGLGVVGAAAASDSETTATDLTPIARLVREAEGIVVPADSPWQDVQDLARAWRRDPAAITVGGGSGIGGPDHLFGMRLADELGVDPTRVRYRSYDGGGPLTTSLLQADVDVGFSGVGELRGQVANGSLRVLAVSGEDRSSAVAAPTLTESGVDLVFSNWRGVMAPPGISEERRAELVEHFDRMRGTDQWQQALDRNGWRDGFLTGEDFADFLADQEDRVTTTLRRLGLRP
ncbi:hypothetical protein KUV85_00935 [Nocardioides panacisoli]|uniref:Bug family tripartite tricarboxylate transporter substrate binding protein n=1 Tax=Nocardioides panacisoli TaxID=627624 RepID=UPI001C62E4AD|nr:tripartite tricarboxylate transporter substrate-binding protein [Nocardioides panacisoli]QYJ04278.1 hypothetical protein KUV85_00935 [Nocardioides panacisoli]